MNAAILNNRNEVVFAADVDEGVREIDVAGTVDTNGYPVNRKTYRVSRSRRNLDKADRIPVLLEKRKHGELVFYTEVE